MSILPLLLLLPILLAACAPGGNPQSTAEAADVPFDVLVEETYSTFEDATRDVVQDTVAWSEAWQHLRGTTEPPPPQPDVDFSEDVVAVAALGTKPTGGHVIAVDRIARAGDAVVVHVAEIEPGPGCMLMQALTSPAVAVRFRRPGVPITFETRTETVDC